MAGSGLNSLYARYLPSPPVYLKCIRSLFPRADNARARQDSPEQTYFYYSNANATRGRERGREGERKSERRRKKDEKSEFTKKCLPAFRGSKEEREGKCYN